MYRVYSLGVAPDDVTRHLVDKNAALLAMRVAPIAHMRDTGRQLVIDFVTGTALVFEFDDVPSVIADDSYLEEDEIDRGDAPCGGTWCSSDGCNPFICEALCCVRAWTVESRSPVTVARMTTLSTSAARDFVADIIDDGGVTRIAQVGDAVIIEAHGYVATFTPEVNM